MVQKGLVSLLLIGIYFTDASNDAKVAQCIVGLNHTI